MSTITRLESLVKYIYSMDRQEIENALLQIISDAKKPTPKKPTPKKQLIVL